MWQGRWRLWLELALWLGIGVGAYAMSFQFDDPIQGYRYGATAWPRAIILAMMAIAAIQFLIGLRAPASPSLDGGASRWLAGIDRGAAFKIVLAFTLPLLYVFLLRRTGFYLTTPVFLAAYLYLLGERNAVRIVLVTAIIYVLMNAIFTTIFYVPLPVGNWPVFYDINTWLLESYR